MRLFAGSSHPALAKALAAELGVSLGVATLKTFSSGELYVKFEESVRGKDVYILQTSARHPNENLMELLLMCQAARLSFARSVNVILPYFPYARQDRVSSPREPISAKLVADLLEKSGADHVITLDLHSDQIQGFFGIPVDALDARSIFADYFKRLNLPHAVVVAPDAGGAKRAKKFADMIGAELAIIHKSRIAHHQAKVLEVVGDIEGKTCIIFDDMIDTASTLCPAKEALITRKADKKVYAAATHAILSGTAFDNLAKAQFEEVVVTDSIPHDMPTDQFKVLPIAPLLAKVLRQIERGESVTVIYDGK